MMDNRRSLLRWVATAAICLVWVGAISIAATPGDPVLAVGCDLPSTVDDGERTRVEGLRQSAKQAEKLAALTVDYPLDGTIFPPDIIAPTFLWHDAAGKADAWVIEVRFGKDAGQAHVLVPGMPPPEGEVDPLAIASTNEVYQMTPYQASAVAWKPAADLWAAIKRLSTERPTVVTVRGYAQGDPRRRDRQRSRDADRADRPAPALPGLVLTTGLPEGKARRGDGAGPGDQAERIGRSGTTAPGERLALKKAQIKSVKIRGQFQFSISNWNCPLIALNSRSH